MATLCWSSESRLLAQGLLHPRAAAWMGVSTLLIFAGRMLFNGLALVPYALPFHPAVALVPPLITIFGPGAVWGIALGGLAADLLAGVPAEIMAFRALGWIVAGLWLAQRLARQPDLYGLSYLRYAACILPPLWLAAVWAGLGVEWQGWYPLGYITLIAGIQHSVFSLLLGIPLYGMIRENHDEENHIPWPATLSYAQSTSRRLGWGLDLLLLGILALGVTLSLRAQLPPWQSVAIGQRTGEGTGLLLLGFLSLHLLLLLLRFKTSRSDTAAHASAPEPAARWADFME